MAKYKCDTCATVREFASAYPNIYCQEIDCPGLMHREASP